MYRNSDQAFGEFDFSGLGYITQKCFLDSKLVKNRLKYSEKDLKLYFNEYNLFP